MKLAEVIRVGLPLGVVLFFVVALVWPVWRVYRQSGEWPVVFDRKADPFQKLMKAVFSVYLLSCLVWSVLVAWWGPFVLGVWSVPPAVTIAGGAVFLTGVVLIVWAQHQMGLSWRVGIDDRPTQLVTDGLFGCVRNPIFSGMLVVLAAVVLLTPSAWTLMGLLLGLLLMGLQTRLEERHLLQVHGAEYAAYASRVGRFFPWIGRLSPSD